MAMLSKAKDASKKEEPKKKKHPSPEKAEKAPAAQAPDADEEAPDADSDGGQDEAQSQGGGGPDDSADQGDQQPSGGDDDAGGQQQQPPGNAEGGQQGGSPVPDPNAPGAGDTTSGGDDTPDEDDAQMGPAGTGSENSVPQVPISKGMQEEYQRVDAAIQQELYGPGPLAQHVLETLQPQGKAKVQSVTMMTLVLTRGLYKKFQFPIQLAAHIMHDIAGRVMEIGEQAKGIQYSDHDASLIIGAVMEGGMRIFGVNNGQVKNLIHHVGKSALVPHAEKYHSTITVAKQALAANGQGAQPAPGAPAAPQGAAPPAQPGAGADQSAGEPGEDQAQPPQQGGGEEE